MELNLDWRRRQSAVWPEVSYELRPLRVWAFQELLAFWEAEGAPAAGVAPPAQAEANAEADADANPGAEPPGPRAPRPSLAATARLMGVAQRILPEHVRGLSGLRVRGGGGAGPSAGPGTEPAAEPVVPELMALCEEVALLPLAAEMVSALVEISALDAGAEIN